MFDWPCCIRVEGRTWRQLTLLYSSSWRKPNTRVKKRIEKASPLPINCSDIITNNFVLTYRFRRLVIACTSTIPKQYHFFYIIWASKMSEPTTDLRLSPEVFPESAGSMYLGRSPRREASLSRQRPDSQTSGDEENRLLMACKSCWSTGRAPVDTVV